ncbi:MAG: FxDxF family PEP-CTERM protein [Gammaproteobacteria bacterium]|jgi:hypothetical protein|nr:FxDxF family PEP-CTERM protein [Gammaproteobacteria bacterium]MBU0773517.1 FxDxF family PEP-CTERM protein [Gammaproteobacteria bacterium]MBU0857719.1 FxDxF family PEP-CTERM protein [Gammaproteobacteria bacterium]MBU1848135.1 FxDxF family PEP-CTERM protein [Gammaproteobacteria bacterium]
MKKTLVAAAVSGLLAVSGAQAATTNWDVHAPVEVGASFVSGSFMDIFTFTLASDTSLSTIGSSTESALFGIADPMIWLYKEMGAVDTFISAYSFDHSFTIDSLAAGDYYYKVTGITTGSTGGVYTLVSSTAPVPEPETYMMLLGGLGMIGLMAKRRMS